MLIVCHKPIDESLFSLQPRSWGLELWWVDTYKRAIHGRSGSKVLGTLRHRNRAQDALREYRMEWAVVGSKTGLACTSHLIRSSGLDAPRLPRSFLTLDWCTLWRLPLF